MPHHSHPAARPDYDPNEPADRDTSAHSEALFNRIPHLRPASDSDSPRILIPTDPHPMRQDHSQDSDPSQSLSDQAAGGSRRKEFSPQTRNKRDIQNRRKVPHDVNDQIAMWKDLMDHEQRLALDMTGPQMVETLFTLFSNLPIPAQEIVPAGSKVAKKKAKHRKEQSALKLATVQPMPVNMDEECRELKESIDLYNHLNNDVFQSVCHQEDNELYIIFSQEH